MHKLFPVQAVAEALRCSHTWAISAKGKNRLWRKSQCLKQICPRIWCNHWKRVKELQRGRAKRQKKAAQRSWRCCWSPTAELICMWLQSKNNCYCEVVGQISTLLPPRFHNQLFVCVCGAYLTCQFDEQGRNLSVQTQLILRQRTWRLFMLLGLYTSTSDLACQRINTQLTAFHSFSILHSARTVFSGCLWPFLSVPSDCFCAFSAHFNTEANRVFQFSGQKTPTPTVTWLSLWVWILRWPSTTTTTKSSTPSPTPWCRSSRVWETSKTKD